VRNLELGVFEQSWCRNSRFINNDANDDLHSNLALFQWP
jgi:hypothetical protein